MSASRALRMAAYGLVIALAGVGTYTSAQIGWQQLQRIGSARAEPPPLEKRIRLAEARTIGAALVLFAQQNGGNLPDDLEDLHPDYLGEQVDVRRFELSAKGRSLPWSERSYEVIARERAPEIGDGIYIFGSGDVMEHMD